MEITIRIEVPELEASNLLTGIAAALGGKQVTASTITTPAEPTTGEASRSKKTKTTKTPKVTEAEPQVEDAAPAAEDKPGVEEAATYTLVQVREKLAELSQAGKQAQVKALIGKFGASKLSEIKEENYVALMKEAGDL